MQPIARILLVTALILMIPLVMMRFSDEWDWRLPDFVIIGTLLIGAGLMYEFLVKPIRKTAFRVAAAVLLLAAVLLIWAELAVGVFETPFAGS